MRFFILKLIFLVTFTCTVSAQEYWHAIKPRNYTSDTTLFCPKKKPWAAASEVFGINIGVWTFNRFIMHEDFAMINGKTIKNNFKTGPVWDVDKFSTNLFAHPYHGSLYFNVARSNGMNFWQSIPYTLGGSLMWEFFMETEPPSINDMMATTFGGIELGEITYRLSDIFIDNRTSGKERVGREILVGLISPIRGINRLISGEAWKYSPQKGRSFSNVPVRFIVSAGARFLADQDYSTKGSLGMNINFDINYGNPFEDESYSPYEWFRFHLGMDLLSSQPLISQVNAVGALWGTNVWKKNNRSLMFGMFQHFGYYNSSLRKDSNRNVAPYRISEAAAAGPGIIYYKKPTSENDVAVFGELYTNGIALGASLSDYLMLGERDYNLGSGYSVKSSAGLIYKNKIAFILGLDNYHIFTWKGYEPDMDWSEINPEYANIQGDKSNARLTTLSMRLAYLLKNRWFISANTHFYTRQTQYKYYETVDYSTYDFILSVGYRL